MDRTLRCNSLKCRASLEDHAVVTTCSHIFCVSCSESLGLSNSHNARVCPACEAHLSNPDDAVTTQLNPTEDYKTSVLSGLSPTIIMECVSRGMNFYVYQISQEILYEEYLTRSLTEKYSTLSNQMDKVIYDANAEIGSLQEKLGEVRIDQQQLQQKNKEIASAYREKAKQHQSLQKAFTKLKRDQLAAGIENAANHDAEQVLQNAATGLFNDPNQRNGQQLPSRNGSNGSGRRNNATQWDGNYQVNRNGAQSARSNHVPTTPSGHRTRLPQTLHSNRVNMSHGGSGTPHRPVFGTLDANVYGNSGIPVYGGMKAGRLQNGHNGVGVGRSHGVAGLGLR